MGTSADDSDVQRLRAALADALEERARLWDELQRRTATQHEVEHLNQEIAWIRSTISWRVTAPLRAGRIARGKLRRRLGPIGADVRTMLRRR